MRLNERALPTNDNAPANLVPAGAMWVNGRGEGKQPTNNAQYVALMEVRTCGANEARVAKGCDGDNKAARTKPSFCKPNA